MCRKRGANFSVNKKHADILVSCFTTSRGSCLLFYVFYVFISCLLILIQGVLHPEVVLTYTLTNRDLHPGTGCPSIVCKVSLDRMQGAPTLTQGAPNLMQGFRDPDAGFPSLTQPVFKSDAGCPLA